MVTFDECKQAFADQVLELTYLAKGAFRNLDVEAREEAAQNAVAMTWKAYCSLIEEGRGDEPGLIRSCLWFAIRQTRSGRFPQGLPKAKDACEARRRGHVTFERAALDTFVSDQTAVPDAVSFRLDVPEFLARLSDRQQRMAGDLMSGMKTGEVAAKHCVTAGAVSQFRLVFKQRFEEFVGV